MLNSAGDERPDIGGVTVLVSRQILNSSSPPRELVAGRVVEVCIGTGPCTSYVHFVHNFRLGLEGMARVESAIFDKIRQGKTVFLCGDFNMDPPGERRISVSDPGGQGSIGTSPGSPGGLLGGQRGNSSAEGRAKVSVQAVAYKYIAAGSPNPWPQLIERRLETIAPEIVVMDLPGKLEVLATALKPLGPRFATTVIKTLTDSWCTSRRFGDARQLGCFLGCSDCDDELEHYLVCDPLWTILVCCAGLDASWLARGVDSKLGLNNPTRCSILLMVVAHRVYHTLRNQHMDKVIAAQNNSSESVNLFEVHTVACELAVLHSKVVRLREPN